jgi:hypothetical protein
MSVPVEVKGHVLRQQLAITEELLGVQRVTAFRQRLPDALRALHPTGLLAGGWYPVEWSNDAYASAVETMPAISDWPERVAREGIERDMNGIYRFLLRLITLEIAFANAGRVLSTYLRGPQVSVSKRGPSEYAVVLTEASGIGPYVWRDVCAGLGRLAETAGAQASRVSVVAGGRAADSETTIVIAILAA